MLYHREGEGPDFRLLGPVFDPKLLMHKAVQKVLAKRGQKYRHYFRQGVSTAQGIW